MNSKSYKWCVVPQCTNTSIKTPLKLFIYVPNSADKRRTKWLQLARRDPTQLSTKSSIYFCEDHFDLPNDMENYMEYKIMGLVRQICMKPGCLPSKFQCQPDRKKRTSAASTSRSAVMKRQKMSLIEESQSVLDQNKTVKSTDVSLNDNSLSSGIDLVHDIEKKIDNKQDKSVQVCLIPHYRSKGTQTQIQMHNKAISPLKTTAVTCSTSPFKFEDFKGIPSTSGITAACKKLVFIESENSDSEVSSYTSLTSWDSLQSLNSYQWNVTSDNSSLNAQELKVEDEHYSKLSLKNTLRKIKKKPRFYIGILTECYYIIDIIQNYTKIPEEHILLCLKKIRLDTRFAELGDEFGISLSYASKIFSKNVSNIANVLRPFIVKLDRTAIEKNLPIAFRHKYNKVNCIIDCLEIEIQKPSKSLEQALTWSEYKKANTIKYLISSTPDGLINYISPGYGGRISDVLLVEKSNFLETLESGSCILADRGFKHVEQLLLERGCQLLRPPSVATGTKLSKQEARETKEIASLRIHIERVIRRVREFSMLKPHSVLNTNLINVLDDAIMIACVLINLQDAIIK